MSALSGMNAIVTYDGADNKANVQKLIDALPNLAATHGTGAVAVPPTGATNTYLDEMSPAAVAQLHVDLLALKEAIDNV